MQLITKVEINYLRSLYKANLNKVGDLNIVFGRNDSGKSNLLRALNLFFNEETDPARELDFDIDMSGTRRSEAQKVKGRQFIWIKLTIAVPKNFQKSLGPEITIKKQWNRDGDVTETIGPNSLTTGQSAQLTKFRNQIDFTYIPAIKDLEVYADLIERVYGAAAEASTLQDATTQFVNAIQFQASALQSQLTDLFGDVAKLAPPTDMRRLFRNLDFAHGEEGHSLLLQKGDGIKARHLPELLRFINENENNKKFFIWGFEEPENSLDLGAAEMEARRLADFAGRHDTQVFITSHSPAFYLAETPSSDTQIKRYFITKQKSENDQMIPADAVSAIDTIEAAEEKMEKAGLMQLPFTIKKLSELHEDNERLQKECEELRKNIQKIQKPTLFVEGKHDRNIFADAFNRAGHGNIDVKILEGSPKTTAELLKAVERDNGALGHSPSFFLFDNDRAGRSAYKNICNSSPADDPHSITEKISVWVIQRTPEFSDFMNTFGIPEEHSFFTSEFLFPAQEAANLCNEIIDGNNGKSKADIENWLSQIHGDYFGKIAQMNFINLIKLERGTSGWLYARGIPESIKDRFAKEANSKNLQTTAIDSIATKIISHLTNVVN